MHRLARVRRPPGHGVTASHKMRETNPALADRLERAMSDHVAPGTAKSYQSAVRRFTGLMGVLAGAPNSS